MIPVPHSLVATGSFSGHIPPKQSSNKINQWSFYQTFRMSSRPAHTKSPAIDDFLGTVLDPQFVGLSFLPRKTEDSTTVIWVYLYTQCDFVKTFFQRKNNVWNTATIGMFVPNEQNSVKKRFCYSVFTTLKNASLRNPVETPSVCRASWPKEQAKQEIYTKISKLQFCSGWFLSRRNQLGRPRNDKK